MNEMILHEGGLEFRTTDGEPRIRDLDLAERLGYERPRNIRNLIDRFRNDLGVCFTVEQTSSALGGRPGVEYWLTEEQALFIVAKSDTSRATEMLKFIITVFVAVRRQIDRDQQALKSLPQRLVEALLLPAPTPDWERMFQSSLVKAICELHGEHFDGGQHPRWMASTNRKIYDLVFSSPIGRTIKERNPMPKHGSNHHQHLTPEAREYLAAQLKIVEAIARQSSGKIDFWRRMEREYAGGMLQLSLGA